MRWEIATSGSGHELYHLYQDDRKLLALSFNPLSNSARIEFDKEKRVFLVRKEGFRKRKIVLRSEYGIKIGELGHENKQDFIEVNNDRFYYSVRNNPQSELILYKESKEKPVMTCGLDPESGKSFVEFDKNRNAEFLSHSGLLMALCWYMFIPVAKESIPEFA